MGRPPSLQRASGGRDPGGGRTGGPLSARARASLGRVDALSLALVALGLLLALGLGWALASARGRGASVEVGRVEQRLADVMHAQEQLRLEVQQGREAALLGLAGAAQDLQGRLAQAQRALA